MHVFSAQIQNKAVKRAVNGNFTEENMNRKIKIVVAILLVVLTIAIAVFCLIIVAIPLKEVQAVAATCETPGMKKHYVNPVTGICYEDGNRIKSIDKSGLYIEPAGHDIITHVSKVEATCTEAGVKEHWECSNCDKFFLDQEGKKELTDIVEPARGHTEGTPVIKEASCTEQGEEKIFCVDCGKELSKKVIPMLKHNYTQKKAEEQYIKSPATDTSGIVYYKSCIYCGMSSESTSEESTFEQVIATFEFNDNIYDIQVVNKNSLLTVAPPASTPYVIFNGWTVNGKTIDISTFRITSNTKIVADVTFKFEVKFMANDKVQCTQIVEKDNVPAIPNFDADTFLGWTVDGTYNVDIATYKITAPTLFTAKFGTWTSLYDSVIHVGGNADETCLNVSFPGLRVGEKIKVTLYGLTVKDGRDFPGGSYNNLNGFTYVGCNGNFYANPEWSELDQEDSILSMEKEVTSMEDWTTVVGHKNWYENNEMTFKVYCAEDNLLTIEWTSTTNFYISEVAIWHIYVLR